MAIKVHCKVPRTDYTLLERDSEFQPFILAYMYDPEDGTWAQGHYFQTVYQVEAYLDAYAEKYLDSEYTFTVKRNLADDGYVVVQHWQGACIWD